MVHLPISIDFVVPLGNLRYLDRRHQYVDTASSNKPHYGSSKRFNADLLVDHNAETGQSLKTLDITTFANRRVS